MTKRLPDSEFEIMEIVWEINKPVTSSDIMTRISNAKCKAPTIISYLNRLEEKGFLQSEKNGKERFYQAVIPRDEYLKYETKLFFNQYHKNSILSFMNALVQSKSITDEELNELKKQLNNYERNED